MRFRARSLSEDGRASLRSFAALRFSWEVGKPSPGPGKKHPNTFPTIHFNAFSPSIQHTGACSRFEAVPLCDPGQQNWSSSLALVMDSKCSAMYGSTSAGQSHTVRHRNYLLDDPLRPSSGKTFVDFLGGRSNCRLGRWWRTFICSSSVEMSPFLSTCRLRGEDTRPASLGPLNPEATSSGLCNHTPNRVLSN